MGMPCSPQLRHMDTPPTPSRQKGSSRIFLSGGGGHVYSRAVMLCLKNCLPLRLCPLRIPRGILRGVITPMHATYTRAPTLSLNKFVTTVLCLSQRQSGLGCCSARFVYSLKLHTSMMNTGREVDRRTENSRNF